jgi:release factor glutamine methyltransferase
MAPQALGEVRAAAIRWLGARGVPNAVHDVDRLLEHALAQPRLELLLQFERPLSDDEIDRFRPLLARRGRREPLAYILGARGFHAVDLRVHPGVLDPRPDTETLVEVALERIPSGDGEPIFVADVGCGTGAVGLAIAAARPRVRLYAIDLSEEAIANTRENVELLGLGARVATLRGDLLDAVPSSRPIDWVVSNPPYIPSADIDSLMPEVSRWEPRLALDGGPDGLDVVRRLAAAAAARARRGALLEIGHDQAQPATAILLAHGFRDVFTRRDLGRNDRVVGGSTPHRA